MPAIPKPASTVVLMDQLSRIYFTKRPETMKFMGGFYVFPGGAVEKEDDLREEEKSLGAFNYLPISTDYYLAAARELFEEVGVLLGLCEDGSTVQLPKEKERFYRNQLVNKEITFTQILKQEKLQVDLESLTYFGQIITPESHPIRFDTRFFLAKLPKGQTPEPDYNEIDQALWMSPDEALTAFKNLQIKLAPPTIITIETIRNYLNGEELKMTVTQKDLYKLIKENPFL